MGPSGDASKLDADWRASIPHRLERLAAAWREPAAWDGMTRVGGTELPGAVVGIVALGELGIHGWDLARATNQPFAADPDTLVPLYELVRQTFGPGHDDARVQAFGPAVLVPRDATVLDQTLGLLGRNPEWSSLSCRLVDRPPGPDEGVGPGVRPCLAR
jgi:uncharacterized protein (TIGR03086 family)